MKIPAYPVMRDTNLQWLSSVPQHWELTKFRFLFSFGRGLGITKKDLLDEGVPCISYGEIHSKFGFEIIPEKHKLKCVPETHFETGPRSLLSEGDFIFADTSEDIEGSGNFSYLNSKTPTFAGYHTIITRVQTEDHPRYLAYVFDSLPFRHQIRKNVTGVKVLSVTQDVLKNCCVWLPPVNEQNKIVRFLDFKTTKIDQLIEKKKSLIEKLNEQRSAVITQAVTKGLDKTVKMKSSGIDWLGDMPSRWNIEKLRFIGVCQNGINIGAEYFGQGDPFLSYGDVYKNYEIPEAVKGLVQSSDSDKKSYSVECGDIFITRTSETVEEIGLSSVCKRTIDDAVFAGFLIRVRPDVNKINMDFSKYYFRNYLLRAFFVKEMNLVTRASLSQELLKKLPVLLPPIEEQIDIAKFLDRKTQQIDKMISKVRLVLERLEEYRSAIITDSVTGKIDIRNIQIPVAKDAA